MQYTFTPEMINELVANIGWVIHATDHILFGSSPDAAIFGRDILFDIPYLAVWTETEKKRQLQVDKFNIIQNQNLIVCGYMIGQHVVLVKDGIFRKAEDDNLGPFTIIDEFVNGKLKIQHGTMDKRLDILKEITSLF